MRESPATFHDAIFFEKLLQTPLAMPISQLEPICKHGSRNAANSWRLIQFDPLDVLYIYINKYGSLWLVVHYPRKSLCRLFLLEICQAQ